MAHGDMLNKFHEKLNFHRTYEADGKPVQPSEEVIDKLFPKTADVIARAEELYKFVEDNE
jgi:hypothetical protein